MNKTEIHVFRRRWSAALSVLLLLCLALTTVVSAEETPMPTPVDYANYNKTHDLYEDRVCIGLYYPISEAEEDTLNILYQIRQTLQHSGYYGQTPPNYNHNFLEQSDLIALQNYWFDVTGRNYPTDKGLTYGARDLILQPAAPQEPPHEYRDIPWQQGSEDLPPLLDRLYRLGYLADITHPVYDEDVREAVRQFCENNGMPSYYDADDEKHVSPLSADLQRRLIEDEDRLLNPKPSATPEPPAPYFLRPVKLGGIRLPMWALWAFGLVVLLAGVLVIINLFMPSEGESAAKKKNMVHFSVSYKGKTQQAEVDISSVLKIGRGIGKFPLDLSDLNVSRDHCEIYYKGGQLMLKDHSSNGTTVNGKPLNNAECKLSSGDIIGIGDHIIVVTF